MEYDGQTLETCRSDIDLLLIRLYLGCHLEFIIYPNNDSVASFWLSDIQDTAKEKTLDAYSTSSQFLALKVT